MEQTSIVDSDCEFFHEEGLTFEDLAVGDQFTVQESHYVKMTDNTASRLGLGPDRGGYGTFLPSQPVTRYGDFQDFWPGIYVTRHPANADGSFMSPPFARLPIGEIFTVSNGEVYYRKLTPTKAVRLNPSSPLLQKALNPGGSS